jgi:hypothetical protein
MKDLSTDPRLTEGIDVCREPLLEQRSAFLLGGPGGRAAAELS